jgi:NAD(P)-dependent dehydrogenase (short-subunit alcohol dehydrogenase family)
MDPSEPDAKKRRTDSSTKRAAGKVFVITGSTQGLGEEIAMQLAQEGAEGLIILGRNKENGDRVAEALLANGAAKVKYVQCDLSKAEDCKRVIEVADAEFGRIDGLVNSAASTARGTWDDATVDHLDFLYAVNLRAPFLMMQAASKVMKREGKGGSIVNIGSVNGSGGMSKLPMYSATKGALETLTKNAAFSFRKDKIRVNNIAVGWMATPAEHATMLAEGKGENWLEEADATHPFGRILRPADVAKLVTHLLSDDAAMQTASIIHFHEQFIGTWD